MRRERVRRQRDRETVRREREREPVKERDSEERESKETERQRQRASKEREREPVRERESARRESFWMLPFPLFILFSKQMFSQAMSSPQSAVKILISSPLVGS